MSKTIVVWSCAHTKPNYSNERFTWLGKLLYDIRPDMCIDLGDGADMNSLNSFDTKSPQSIVTQSYEGDIDSYHDSQERLRHEFKKRRRKMPTWVGFEGNHEHRIKTAIKHDPRLKGGRFGISFSHLQTNRWFNEYHEYHNSAPAIADYDGVSYAHFFSSGNFGKAASGLHHAHKLLQDRGHSSTCGHSHKRNLYFKDGSHPRGIIGLVAGCFKGSDEAWAGQANRDWWKGVVIKREVCQGVYDPEFVSLDRLKKEYG